MTYYDEKRKSRVIRRVFLFSILIMAFLAVGCGKEKVKPSEDALLTGDALQAISLFKDAYEKKDVVALEGIADAHLLDEIKKELFFDEARITFSTPRLVRISDADVKVSQNWQSEWTVEGQGTKSRGVSNIVYGRDSGKLVRIDGDNPFQIPLLRGTY